MLILILSVLLIVIDQISKILVSTNLYEYDSISIISNFFNITYAKNIGAAFSLLKGGRIIFIFLAILVIILLTIYIKNNYNNLNKIDKISLILILSGSTGNLIDRIIYGYVIDFLDFKIFNYNYPIFNLADTYIVIGAILMLFNMIKKEHK